MSERAQADGTDSFLSGVRVLELADELGEYCGKVLAGLGAEVIKIEPPDGERTRRIGPFLDDSEHPDRSLYFWHYNFGKQSVVLDLDREEDQERFRDLARDTDVIIDTRPAGYLSERKIGYEELSQLNIGLIMARISPFGATGPWSRHKGSDLIHLALGGVVMNNGYDPDPDGVYETPPVAPQMWQAYQITGEMTVIALLGALYYRQSGGLGQLLSTSVHGAVAQQTELDLPNWVYGRLPHYRRTARHSLFNPRPPTISMTKDGRWLATYRTYLGGGMEPFRGVVALLDRYGMADDLKDERYNDPAVITDPKVDMHVGDLLGRLVGRFMFSRDLWLEAQELNQTWAPVRKPEENADDEHWRIRGSFVEVDHPELQRTFTEIGAKWVCPEVPWRQGPRAPLLGEHTDEVLGGRAQRAAPIRVREPAPALADQSVSKHGRPFALADVLVVDLGWILASGGAGRFLASQGANVIKVEHRDRLDQSRWTGAPAPPGGRAERDAATGPMLLPPAESPNRSGCFNEVNAGKRAISLNLRHARGKELLEELIRKGN
ncbi:MAG: hypothetical protein QOH26_1836, partial [Actinomycetota bacterium]|nr:hypothetical protein [Actinomycetota bacterium]